jgi:shikimate dehydrogenase
MQLAMERVFANAKIDWRYLTLDVAPEKLDSALRGMQALGFQGAHLHGPHRFQAIEYVDQAEESAKRSGWIDCITVTDQGLVGQNWWGKTLRDVIGPPSKEDDSIVFVGGNAGVPAVVAELLEAGWRAIHFEGFSKAIIQEYSSRLGLNVPLGQSRWSATTRAVIVGEDANTTDLIEKARLSRLAGDTLVIDLSQSGSFSAITRTAESAGLRALSSLDVLVRYTAATFAAWTGIQADEQILRESFEEYYEI